MGVTHGNGRPGKAKKYKFKAISEGWAWAERHWLSVTEDTGVGDPSKATAKKGEIFLESLYQKIGDFLYEVATTGEENCMSNSYSSLKFE